MEEEFLEYGAIVSIVIYMAGMLLIGYLLIEGPLT